MSFTREQLFERLAALEDQAGRPSRYVIAFSGGLDSSVLAHALAGADCPVLAVHIDHGLQEQSAEWARHCEAFAESLDVGFRCRRVEVQLESGKGPEASARDARYSALHAELEPGDWLLSAHHREGRQQSRNQRLSRGVYERCGCKPGFMAVVDEQVAKLTSRPMRLRPIPDDRIMALAPI